MSDIVKLGGSIGLGTLIGGAVRIFGASGIPQAIVVQVFTDLLSDSLSNALKGDGEKDYTFSEEFIGNIGFPGSVLELDGNEYGVRVISSGSRVTRFGYDTVSDGVEAGGYAFGDGGGYIEEGKLNLREQMLLVPEYDKAKKLGISYFQIYVEFGVTCGVTLLKRTEI